MTSIKKNHGKHRTDRKIIYSLLSVKSVFSVVNVNEQRARLSSDSRYFLLLLKRNAYGNCDQEKEGVIEIGDDLHWTNQSKPACHQELGTIRKNALYDAREDV